MYHTATREIYRYIGIDMYYMSNEINLKVDILIHVLRPIHTGLTREEIHKTNYIFFYHYLPTFISFSNKINISLFSLNAKIKYGCLSFRACYH